MASIAVPLHSRKHSNLVAYVDEQDYDLVSQYRWNVQPGRNTFYAVAIVNQSGRNQTIRMHRLIASPGSGLFVDHIDGNGLNNCRTNLQIVTNRENLQRQIPRTATSSRFTGVYFDRNSQRRPWKAFIGVGNEGAPRYLGRFATEFEAAHAYDAALDALGLTTRYRNLGRVEKSRDVEASASTENQDLKPYGIKEKSEKPQENRCCRNVEEVSAPTGKMPSTFRPDLTDTEKPP